ncbi:IS21 family transposase [Rhodococcus sp. T2V]|uniref:IS21 family transposase n=1 Tax=Rhodococcus sp. T2V TaxID=3034164 RepID=UPI0023E0F740|nr:IS21 family transposase [Rhodococcus sp. T2V]MDF3310895.1 IS21 family transposase [Rhodococcus sp. T2V]
MKSAKEAMEILEAYDLTKSYRAAAALAGCSHHTVARLVAARDTADVPTPPRERRPMLIDEYLPKIEEWVEHSKGRVRADVAHDKLLALGFTGTERTTRRAVARVKRAYRLGHTRVHRPWVTEPGLWLQYDFGDGPVVDGIKTVLLCAWLAWCRHRVVIPLRDRTAPSVYAGLDRIFRQVGGVPTYLLTDNEKMVTTEHIASVAVRNPGVVSFARHYGLVVKTCLPADPATKGGVENTVKLAKADLVPTDHNLAAQYDSFDDLEAACTQFCDQVNTRIHRTTRRIPAEMLAEERLHLHPVPAAPHTVTWGVTRIVPDNTPMIAFENGQYSVPHTLRGQTVWVRAHSAGAGERIVVVHHGEGGPVEVARHRRARPGSPQICDEHFPPPPAGVLGRQPIPRTDAERAFCDIGAGARLWLCEAAEAGTGKIRVKMEHAVSLAKLLGAERVDWALGHAAAYGRFAEGDLMAILDAHPAGTASDTTHRADESRSLAQGTAGWARFGAPTLSELTDTEGTGATEY